MRNAWTVIDLVLKSFAKHFWKIMLSRDDDCLQSLLEESRDLFGKPATFFIWELYKQLSSLDSMIFQKCFAKDFKTKSITHQAFLIV